MDSLNITWVDMEISLDHFYLKIFEPTLMKSPFWDTIIKLSLNIINLLIIIKHKIKYFGRVFLIRILFEL